MKPWFKRVLQVLAACLVALTGISVAPLAAQAYTQTCGSYGSTPSFACVSFSGFHGQSPWGYPTGTNGHNCTNYASYRLWQNGVTNPRNLGGAKDWDNSAVAYGIPVNNTPAVGTIAVWEAYSPPASEFGHVAYVDAVGSNYIDISEDNYGGTSMTKRLYVGESWYPDHFIHFKDIVSTPPSPSQPSQLIVQRQGVNVYAKAGFGDAWAHLASNAIDLQVAETRIVTRDSAHMIYGKEGIEGTWYTLADHVDEYAVSSNLVVIRKGTTVFAKADLWDPWIQIANDAIDIQVAGTRIGHRDANHELYMNDGLRGPWYHVASGVDEYKLSPSLIVQRQGVNVYAKAGFGDAWAHLASNAIDIQVSGNRIGNRDAAHHLYVKDGIGGTWYTLADNVDEFVLTSNLIVQRQGTAVFVKASPTSAWVQIANDAIDIQTAGTRIGHRNSAHELYMNDSLTGSWYDVASSVDEFDLS